MKKKAHSSAFLTNFRTAKAIDFYEKWALFTYSIMDCNCIGAAGGLSGQVRGYRTGCLWAAVAPRVASSPHGSCRRYPCGHASSIPAAGVVE